MDDQEFFRIQRDGNFKGPLGAPVGDPAQGEMLIPISRRVDLVAESMTAARVQADQKQMVLGTHIPPSRPMIRGDRLRLRQILINLLSNAIKFMEMGVSRCPSFMTIHASASCLRHGHRHVT